MTPMMHLASRLFSSSWGARLERTRLRSVSKLPSRSLPCSRSEAGSPPPACLRCQRSRTPPYWSLRSNVTLAFSTPLFHPGSTGAPETGHFQSQQGLPFHASDPSRRINGNKPSAAIGSAQLTFQSSLTTRPANGIKASLRNHGVSP